MKSLRHISTISALALCAVFAIAQDSGLGRGRGGGSSSGGGAPRTAPPSSAPRSTPPPSTTSPSRQTPPPPTNSGQSRDRGDSSKGSGGSTSGGSQDSGLGRSRDQGSSGGGSSRDRGTSSGGSQDSGLGRTRDGGSSSSGSSRDRSGSTTSRDRGSSTTSGDRGSSSGNNNSRSGGSIGSDNPGLGRSRSGSGTLTTGRAPQERSQSGEVRYQSNNNQVRVNNPVRFGSPQAAPGIVRTDSLTSRAFRQDFPRNGNNGLVWNGWRTGYRSYWNNWNDNFFWYPNYCFDPFVNVNIVISPWYHYSFLPGYLNCNRVIVTNWVSPWAWNAGSAYVWNDGGTFGWNNSNNRRYDQDVEEAIEDVRDTFERYDRRSLDRLIPRDGQIAIMRDGRYDYSLNTQDFYDLLNDLASNAETKRYRIDEIRTSRNSMRVSATHEYIDPWGNRQRVFHMYYLERERGGMVIREFGTSDRRF